MFDPTLTLEKRLQRLEEAKEMFCKALLKVREACDVAKEELTKPLNSYEQMEIEAVREGKLDI